MIICPSCILLGCCSLFVVSTGGVIIGFTNIMIAKLTDGINLFILLFTNIMIAKLTDGINLFILLLNNKINKLIPSVN